MDVRNLSGVGIILCSSSTVAVYQLRPIYSKFVLRQTIYGYLHAVPLLYSVIFEPLFYDKNVVTVHKRERCVLSSGSRLWASWEKTPENRFQFRRKQHINCSNREHFPKKIAYIRVQIYIHTTRIMMR